MEPKIEEFISSLVTKIQIGKVFDSIKEEINETQNWDYIAKRKVGELTKEVFQQVFPEADLEKAVWIEKKGVRFELFLGDVNQPKHPYDLFGGLGVYPDIAVTVPTPEPKRIFVELDNGRNSSKLKTALAKAAFDYMTKDCDYCFEFFHNRSRNRIKPFLDRQREKAILEELERVFHTKLFLFE